MTRFSLWLVAATAALGMATGLSAQDAPKSKFWPFEIQGGASWMWYDSHWGQSENGALSTEFIPRNPRITPSVRLSLDVYSYKKTSFLISAAYRFQNDVPLSLWTEADGRERDGYADLKHKSQLSFGGLVRYEVNKNFDLGIGVDARNDWSRASWRAGGISQDRKSVV